MKTAAYNIFKIIFILGLIAIIGIGCGGGDEEDEVNSPNETYEAITSYSEIEITSEGGIISIIDENNNTIEVSFPKDALSATTTISLGVLSEQPDLPVETRHVAAFEIKPYDTVLYKPVSVMVTYGNVIQDIERAMLFREKADSLIVPLANHEYLSSGRGADNNIVRAEAYFLGVFAEGKMSLDQINNQIDLLLTSQETRWEQRVSQDIDSTCYTDIMKVIWDDWKETADGIWELTEQLELQQYGSYNVEAMLERFESICNDIASQGAQLILDSCIPENLCDPNYKYIISDALDTIWRLQCMVGNEVYAELNNRFEEIMTSCIEEVVLKITLSATEVRSFTGGPETSLQSQVSMNARGIVLISVEVAGSGSDFAEIDEKYPGRLLVSGSGAVTYFPGGNDERVCQISSEGYIVVKVAGSRDSMGVYSPVITTRHYTDWTEVCPSTPSVTTPIGHTKSRTFQVVLDSGNNYENTSEADGDPEWEIDVKLLLP